MNRRYLIVNADDFGAGPLINRGIVECHERGILTSASLMTDTPGSEDASALLDRLPRLSVGLHFRLTTEEGKATVDLDDSQACRIELERQLRRFQALTCRLPTHFDVHHNLQRDARLLPHLLQLANRYDVPLREHSQIQYLSKFYAQWNGETHPEQVDVDNLATLLRHETPENVTELSCHPGYVDPDYPSSYAYERQLELQTLCDPRLPSLVAGAGLQLASFSDIRAVAASLPRSEGTSRWRG